MTVASLDDIKHDILEGEEEENQTNMTVDTELLISHQGDDSRQSLFTGEPNRPTAPPPPAAVYRNFVLMAILFSIHHGCVVSCLSLATARLGAEIGAGQSGILYLAYTGTALLGATYSVKRVGPHRAIVGGMFLYCFYVAAFGWAAHFRTAVRTTAYVGAALGGIGAGLVWTAQGSFFAQAATAHAQAAAAAAAQEEHIQDDSGLHQTATTATTTMSTSTQDLSSQSTARMAGVFAFFYLSLELLLRSFSSVASWTALFNTYGLLTIVATIGMAVLVRPPNLVHEGSIEQLSASIVWYQVTAAIQLWKPSTFSTDNGRRRRRWPVMPFLVGMNAVFGLESAFLNAYINGQVVPAQSVGIWSAWASGVAAAGSLLFGRWTAATIANASSASGNSVNGDGDNNNDSCLSNRKGLVLSAGAASFVSVVFPFVLKPNISEWTDTNSSFSSWWIFLFIFTLHGVGRATFEGTLKATFADFFPHEKEGAFANIILQNGLASSLGYFLTSHLACHNDRDVYCVPYKDGTRHHTGLMEFFVLLVGVLGIIGYWQAARMVQQRRQESNERDNSMPDDQEQEDSSRRLV